MRSFLLIAMTVFALISGCAPGRDGRDDCTIRTVGEETGSEIINVTLLIPEHQMFGAEISNRGILVFKPDCDYLLNAFMSAETANYLIDQAQDFQIVHVPSGDRVADAELFIWRFRDASAKPSFFVGSVMSLNEPESLPTFSDKKHFRRLDDVR